MDYTDGSREAKFLQEVLHLIEEAVFRRDGVPAGFMADLIMKEMEEKGFNDKDFSFITISPPYLKDYENALTEEKIPFLVTTDIYGNNIITIQSKNSERLLDIDAMIKKGSSEYTRADYIGSFLATSKKLGREVYSIDLNAETANILAAKAFQHESGFVSSFHNGKVYFDETAAGSKFTNIFLDTGISTIAGTRLGRIKRANNLSESIMVDKVIHAIENKDKPNNTRYFASAFDNKTPYIKVEDGIVEIHEYRDKMDVVKRTYNMADFKDAEAFHHVIATELGKIDNCRDLTEEEFASYKVKKRADLQKDREDYLIKQVEYIAAFEKEDHPRIRDDDEYIITDINTLRETMRILNERIDEETDPERKLELKRYQKELSEFRTEKLSYEELLKFAKSELEIEQRRNPNFKFMSSEQKLQWQLKTMEHILTYSDHKSVTDFMENVKKNNKELTREELVRSFTQYSESFQTVSTEQQQSIADSLSAAETPSTPTP